jgi:hypothetical protein
VCVCVCVCVCVGVVWCVVWWWGGGVAESVSSVDARLAVFRPVPGGQSWGNKGKQGQGKQHDDCGHSHHLLCSHKTTVEASTGAWLMLFKASQLAGEGET